MYLRAGTIDYGRIYEQKTLALFAIRCAMDPDVTDFWVASNIDGFGDFDDVVVSVENRNGSSNIYCLQLKHIDNGRLQPSQLESKKGDFSLDKYYRSYQAIRTNIDEFEILQSVSLDQIDFIIYTNAPLSGKSGVGSLKLENSKGFDVLLTSSSTRDVFKMSNSTAAEDRYDDDFLQHLHLYTNQVSATNLDRLIKNELDSHFEGTSNDVVVSITNFFSQWSLNKDKKTTRLFKKDIQLKLLECLLYPYVLEPKHNISSTISTSTLQLVNDTFLKFNIIPIIQEKSLEIVFASIGHVLREICNIQLDFQVSWNTNFAANQHEILSQQIDEQIRYVVTEKQYYVPHLTIKEFYFSAWQCSKVPLVINCNGSNDLIREILIKLKTVTKCLSFVLLLPREVGAFKETMDVFNSFNDIVDTTLMNKNLQNIFVSLQGKDIQSLEIFNQNVQVLSEITPDVYTILLNGVLNIGETYETDNYYIRRSIQRPRLSYDVLDKTNVMKAKDFQSTYNGALFLLLGFEGHEYIPYKYDNNMMDLFSYIKNCNSGKPNDEKYIITSSLLPSDVVVLQAIETMQNITRKAVHVVKLEKYYLLWLFSRGPVDILHNYIKEPANFEQPDDNQIEEDEIVTKIQSNVNLISSNAGMGKTFLLKSLSNKFEPSNWVCFINLSEHISQMLQVRPKVIEYLTEIQIKMNDKLVQRLCRQIFLDRLDCKNVVWLFDGYDEVSSEEALSFLRYIKQRDTKLWITTRPTYKRDLELVLDTLSFDILHFSEQDNETFVWKYFETFQDYYGYNKEQIQYVANTIKQYSNGLDRTFIDIPLQTRMLVEIFGDDIHDISEDEKLTIVELYSKFVDVKLKEYKSYESTSLKKSLSKLALKLFFTEDQLEDVLDFEELAEEATTFQESYKKDSIVIGLNERGDAVFGHRTFAEFLAAQWLSKQIITRKGQFNDSWLHLVQKLFDVSMISVRAFFDRILCKNLPLHQAVLENDVDYIKILLSDESNKSCLDKLGRSPLHLAVSYGKYYDICIPTLRNGLRTIRFHNYIQEQKEGYILEVPIIRTHHRISTKIIQILLDHGFLNTPDYLFHYDAFDYAIKSCSLDALNCLFKNLEKDSLLFEPELNFKIFLYCVIYDNLHHILSSRNSYNFDIVLPINHMLRKMFAGYNFRLLKMKYNGSYLTELAADVGGKETLYELLQTGQLSVHDGYPVHSACISGHSDVVELLYKMGADIEMKDIIGLSPTRNHFLKSGKTVRTDITFELFKDKYDSKITSMTPMHYACQNGHLGCIKKLTELGASHNQVDGYGNIPVQYASLYGYINCIEFILNSLSDEDKLDKKVQSVLNIVASKGYSVQRLIECGLNANNLDDDGNAPLILASKNGFPNVIRELAEYCDLNLMKVNESLQKVKEKPIMDSVEKLIKWALNINGDENETFSPNKIDELLQATLFNTNENLNRTKRRELFGYFIKMMSLDAYEEIEGGMAAIHFAAFEGHADCVKALVEVGADRNIEDTIGLGYSAIIWAAMKGHSNVIDVLLATESNPKCFQQELEDAEIALIWASILGFEACAFILLKHITKYEYLESSRNQERIEEILKREYGTYYDKTVRPFGDVENVPLVVASINNHPEVIKLLTSMEYKNNSDLNVALFWASKQGHLASVKFLIESGADENIKTDRNLQVLPIVWASMFGHTDVVRFYLTNKSKEYLNSEEVSLALNFAASRGHYACVKVLLDANVNVNIFSELTGGSPLLCACQHEGNSEIINELLLRNCDINVSDDKGRTALDFIAEKQIFELVKTLVVMGAHQDSTVDESTRLFEDLQNALEWAITNEEYEMIYRLVELGIKRSGEL